MLDFLKCQFWWAKSIQRYDLALNGPLQVDGRVGPLRLNVLVSDTEF